MGGYLFKPDDEQMARQLRKYNFLYFMLHLVYVFVDCFGCGWNWAAARLYH